MYANILEKQFSLDLTVTVTDTNNNQPPCKCHASFLDYKAEQAMEYPPLVSNNAPNTSSTNVSVTTMLPTMPSSPPSNLTPPSTAIMVDYVAELLLLKNEIQALRTMLSNTVDQIKNEIASICTTPMSNEMETNAADSADNNHHHQSTLDIPAIIANLKHDIAKITLKMCAMF